jgi:hypothetical protein
VSIWRLADRFFKGRQSWRDFRAVDSPDASVANDLVIEARIRRLVEQQEDGTASPRTVEEHDLDRLRT